MSPPAAHYTEAKQKKKINGQMSKQGKLQKVGLFI